MNKNELEYYSNLCTIMHKTCGVRFFASGALKRKQIFSTVTVSFLSIYLVGISISSLAFPHIFGSGGDRFFSVVSVEASVALLVISLMDYAFDRSVVAEKLYQSGLKIMPLMRALERELQADEPSVEEIRRIASAYEQEVERGQINHTDSDYALWLINKKASEGHAWATWHRIVHLYETILFYLSALFLHFILTIILVGSTLYYVVIHLSH